MQLPGALHMRHCSVPTLHHRWPPHGGKQRLASADLISKAAQTACADTLPAYLPEACGFFKPAATLLNVFAAAGLFEGHH